MGDAKLQRDRQDKSRLSMWTRELWVFCSRYKLETAENSSVIKEFLREGRRVGRRRMEKRMGKALFYFQMQTVVMHSFHLTECVLLYVLVAHLCSHLISARQFGFRRLDV